jgi:hypothetical protein
MSLYNFLKLNGGNGKDLMFWGYDFKIIIVVMQPMGSKERS